jgi:hypothetical protein
MMILSGVFFFIIITESFLFADADLIKIIDSTNFAHNVPYAVRYKIKDQNVIADNIRQGFLLGMTQGVLIGNNFIPFNAQNGHTHLINECLYVNDPEGFERFQYTQVTEPIDIEHYKDLVSTETLSLTRLSDCTYIRDKNNHGNWEPSITLLDLEYLRDLDISQLRYPFFGLAIFTRSNPSGIMSIQEAIETGSSETKEKNGPFNSIQIEISSSRCAEVEFDNDEGIPSKITVHSQDGRWVSVHEISDLGRTPEGFYYPQKARIVRSYDNHVLRDTSIEVEEMIIGTQALEKYPLLLPSSDEVMVIDERTKK